MPKDPGPADRAIWALSGPLLRPFARFLTVSSSCHQPSPDHRQVSKREQGRQLGAVPGDAPVAGLHVAELALYDPKRVLDLGPNHDDDAVDLARAQSPKEAGREVAKRLTSIARARSFVNWQNRKPLVADLESQLWAIKQQIAPADPAEALALAWRSAGPDLSAISRFIPCAPF